MVAYSARHYGERTWRLRRPRVIVEHYAEAGSAAAVHNTFAPDHPDPELHELPNVCAHFLVSSSGRYLRCRFQIRLRNVIGHAESLGSPYHRERIASLRSQTHGDWSHLSMRLYRRKLGKLRAC